MWTRVLASLAACVLVASACGGREPTASAPREEPTAPAATAPATAAPTVSPTSAARVSVTIAAVGDLMLDRDVEELIATRGAGYPWERVRALFEGADIVLANLEGTLTARGDAVDKEYTFRTDPSLAGTLTAGGIDIVSLANNHTTDFGEAGLRDTLATLDALGIGHFGAGVDGPSAHAALVQNIEGLSVAFLGYADIGGTRFAEATRSGVALADVDRMRAEIAAAAEAHDFVVVTLHTGVEYSDAPSAHQRELALAAVEAGADLVVGHHPHVLHGWERVDGAVVLYSVGNFVFDLDEDDLATLGPGPFLTGVVLVTLEHGAPPRVELRPAFIDPIENRPRPPSEAEAEEARARFREFSRD